MNENLKIRSKITIYPLGSMGWIPGLGMETICYCFFHGDEIFILDAGTGISRLLELRESLFSRQMSTLKRARIFLSHYHFDHCVGLFWLRALLPGIPVTIYAPGQPVYGKPALDILGDLFKRPYSPKDFDELIPSVSVINVDTSGFTVETGEGSINVKVKLNPKHSDPTVSFRFNDWFAYVTDTPPEEETIRFVRGVNVLLHEAYFDSSDLFTDADDDLEIHVGGPHTGSFGAGLVALRAGVERLYLIHHNPESTLEKIENSARLVTAELGIDCRSSKDLEEIEIDF